MTAATRKRLRSLRDLRIRALVGEPGRELVRYCARCSMSFDIEPGGKAKLCECCQRRLKLDKPPELTPEQRSERRRLAQRAYRQTPAGQALRQRERAKVAGRGR